MIVFKTNKIPEDHREYSHIECDVPGCGAVSPPTAELLQESLVVRGWFIAGGKHRCPEHFHNEIEPQGPIERKHDGTEGYVR